MATVGNWVRRHRAVSESGSGLPAAIVPEVATRRPVSELEAENSRLRRELAEAKQDVEILKKATAYFARGSR
ncbi:hypothetical protein GCM10027565_16850 [Bordetella tumulicola]